MDDTGLSPECTHGHICLTHLAHCSIVAASTGRHTRTSRSHKEPVHSAANTKETWRHGRDQGNRHPTLAPLICRACELAAPLSCQTIAHKPAPPPVRSARRARADASPRRRLPAPRASRQDSCSRRHSCRRTSSRALASSPPHRSQRVARDSAIRFACCKLRQLRRWAVRVHLVGRAVVRHQPGTRAGERTDAHAELHQQRLRTAQAFRSSFGHLVGRAACADEAVARHRQARRPCALGRSSLFRPALGGDVKSVGSGRRWRVRRVPKDVQLTREGARKARLGRRRAPTMWHRRKLVHLVQRGAAARAGDTRRTPPRRFACGAGMS